MKSKVVSSHDIGKSKKSLGPTAADSASRGGFRRSRLYNIIWGQREKRPMQLVEKLTLGPIEKWRRFGRFPWKLLLNILLLLLLTYQCGWVYNRESTYVRQVTEALREQLYRPGTELDDKVMSESIFSIPDAICALDQAVLGVSRAPDVFLSDLEFDSHKGTLFVDFDWDNSHRVGELHPPDSAEWTPTQMKPFGMPLGPDACDSDDRLAVVTPYIQSLLELRAHFTLLTDYEPYPGRGSLPVELRGSLFFRRNNTHQSPAFSSNIDINVRYRATPVQILRVFTWRFSLCCVALLLATASNMLTFLALSRARQQRIYSRELHMTALHNKRVRLTRQREEEAAARARERQQAEQRNRVAARLQQMAERRLRTSRSATPAQPVSLPAQPVPTAMAPMGTHTQENSQADGGFTDFVADVFQQQSSHSDSSTSLLADFYGEAQVSEGVSILSPSDEEYQHDTLHGTTTHNGWHFVSILSSTSASAFCLLDISIVFWGFDVDLARQLLLGLATAMAWLNICRYFEHNNQLYLFFMLLKKGSAVLTRYFISVLPIFFAFAFFGIAVFARFEGEKKLFPDTGQAIATLFALLHGDFILDVFAALYYQWPILSRVFMLSFITLFICVVLSTFIVICQDSFTLARKELYGRDFAKAGFRALTGRLRGVDTGAVPTARASVAVSQARTPILAQLRIQYNNAHSPADSTQPL